MDDIVSELGMYFDILLNTPRIDDINNSETNERLEEFLDDVQESIFEGEFYATKAEEMKCQEIASDR